jgi:hypothetical protein
VATIGSAGFLTKQDSSGVESERGSLASQWEAMRSVDRQREADRVRDDQDVVEPGPERHSRKRDRDVVRARDSGFGM